MNTDNYLLAFRMQYGLKQQNLAKWLGCSRSNVSMAESDGRLLAREPQRKLDQMVDIMKKAQKEKASYHYPALEDENEWRKVKKMKQELAEVDDKLDKAIADLEIIKELLFFLDNMKTIDAIDEKEWNYEKKMAINKYERYNYVYRQLVPKKAALEANINALTQLLEIERREQGRTS